MIYKHKITFILPNLNGGGAERVAVNYLRQLDTSKYHITLIVFDKTKDLLELIPKGVRLIDLQTNSTKNSFFVLIKELRSIKPDVVYTTHSRIATLLMFVKPFVSKFKHIARMQSMPSLEKKHGEYGSLKRVLYASGFKSADIVIAQTDQMKKDAVDIFKIDEANIKVLYNPIDKDYIQNNLKNATTPFENDMINIVASGRLTKQKGFDLLIASLSNIVKIYPKVILHILGNDNGDGATLKKKVNNLELQQNVVFLGFQNNPYRYYYFCDLFILSSRWEGFPNAMLENYYLNTPIVATKCVPIVSELIKDGINGYTCEVEDMNCLSEKIIECIENIKRENIKNPEYTGSKLEDLF